jgi:hypothetical protein
MAQRAAVDGANEQKSLDAVQKLSKKCPSASCGVNIEKISGCDHITCKWSPYRYWQWSALTFGSIQVKCAHTSSAGCALHPIPDPLATTTSETLHTRRHVRIFGLIRQWHLQ